ncbi:MAG: hypothetical protein OM95_10910 [Bdellovibrio sp. ArHS]|uniref:alkaline phosphatase D family protein n=1 Tax=Bdellovibrio sp. ArHS TaxID=1569284 RepID=UPI0005830868|nr:alkaline phosphatase D family protein [Bdellovibrio sp. ArHS]KHD88028.1 MAG: hypothetical protein OM95_10910 [Bdellovibrio sp. ArHS]
MQIHSLFATSLLSTLLLLNISCAEKSQAPESMSLKLLRMQAEANYQTDIVQNPASLKSVQRIAFVSGIDQTQPQHFWSTVASHKPDLVIAAGNTVHSTKAFEKPLLAQYKKLDENEDYRKIRQNTPFMATWDELDFGLRHGDSSFQGKNENRDAFVKYWNYIPKLQAKSAKGVEHSLLLGPPGKRVQIIVLDTRFYATPWTESGVDGKFKKNWSKSASLLGTSQWNWLASELKKDSDFKVIVSSLQVAANSDDGERWGLYPHDRQKLFDTIRNAGAKKVIIVSGNRNFGALGKVDMDNYGPLYDLTVGPFNESVMSAEKDRHYIGDAVNSENFGLLEWDWKHRTLHLKILDQENKVSKELSLKI